MKNNRSGCTLVIVIVAVIVILVVVFRLPSCSGDASKEPEQTEQAEQVSQEDPATADISGSLSMYSTTNSAITAGNTYYKNGEFKKAERLYERGIELGDNSYLARNCLGLVYLQQERNKEALELYEKLIPLVKERENCWAYYLNYMIAAHANNISARQALDGIELGNESLVSLAASSKTGYKSASQYIKLTHAVYYNAIYMDMELPLGLGPEAYFDYTQLGFPPDKIVELQTNYEKNWATEILQRLDAYNLENFGEPDPDGEELIAYYKAKNES